VCPELVVIFWRDIPVQVMATDGERTARAELPKRFQQAVDAAAMRAGLVDSAAYLEEWRRETRACSHDLEQEVEAERERLEAAYPADLLRSLVRSGGTRPPDP
jgi:hypothetical protein